MGPLTLRAEIQQWPLVRPFKITGHTFETVELLLITLNTGEHEGRGEAAGVYYLGESATSMVERIVPLRGVIENGIDRESLQELLPACGARNALDCALWDLESKVTGHSAWRATGLERPGRLLTTFTCGAEAPEVMAATARAYKGARAIKLKLTGDPVDKERVRAVRDSLPDVWLGVDANQGFSRPFLERLMPVLMDARIQLIEQPFKMGQEALLDGFQSPIPLAADESAQSLSDIPGLVGRFNVVNIKLDKCGGLTAGLAMARSAKRLGLSVMVGNMIGTSLAMAPAFVLGQLCDIVDLDGPVFLKDDRPWGVTYADGFVTCPEVLWGCPVGNVVVSLESAQERVPRF